MKKEEDILKSIVINPDLVKYHDNWGYYIETPFDAIHMIGLIKTKDGYELCLYYGDSQSQSRAFYSQNINLEAIDANNWEIRPNFHFSSTFRNLIWFYTSIEPKEYISFWKRNLNLLHQHPIGQIPKLVELLSKEKVISVDKQNLQNRIYEKRYTRLNVCAGFGVIHKISDSKINELINDGQIRNFLIEKIDEGLKVIGENGNRFLINFDSQSYPEAELEGDPDGL